MLLFFKSVITSNALNWVPSRSVIVIPKMTPSPSSAVQSVRKALEGILRVISSKPSGPNSLQLKMLTMGPKKGVPTSSMVGLHPRSSQFVVSMVVTSNVSLPRIATGINPLLLRLIGLGQEPGLISNMPVSNPALAVGAHARRITPIVAINVALSILLVIVYKNKKMGIMHFFMYDDRLIAVI